MTGLFVCNFVKLSHTAAEVPTGHIMIIIIKQILTDLSGSRTSPRVFEWNGHRGILGAGTGLGVRLVTAETLMVVPWSVTGAGA